MENNFGEKLKNRKDISTENNFGEKLKKLAAIIGILDAIGILIITIVVCNTIDGVTGFIVLIVSALMTAIPLMLLYGFGELIHTTVAIHASVEATNARLQAIESHMDKQQPSKAESKKAAPANTNSAAPVAAPAAGHEKNNDEPANIPATFLDRARTMNSASEIANAFAKEYGATDNANTQEMLKLLQKKQATERTYGNAKTDAVRLLEKFFEHGMLIHTVDRSNSTLICPVCKKEQKSDRMSCAYCGALFHS